MSAEMNSVTPRKIGTEIFFRYGGEGEGAGIGYEQRTVFCRSFFAAAAECLRRTDVLAKGFFLIIYDEDFYKHVLFSEDSYFH